jgi:ArsR family transcriptional regulator, arsenate/arsenite/antimonite-responsive transcriptional repressor
MGEGQVPTKSTSSKATEEPCCAPLTNGFVSEVEAAHLASLFGALSDPVRLRLLSLVASEGEICSCNLEGPLGKSQSTISHHTKILAEAGLIVGEKRGKWTWWRAVPEQLTEIQRALGGRLEHS